MINPVGRVNAVADRDANTVSGFRGTLLLHLMLQYKSADRNVNCNYITKVISMYVHYFKIIAKKIILLPFFVLRFFYNNSMY